MTDAICATIDGDMWVDPVDLAQARVAIALCRSCPALTACLDWYLDTGGPQIGVAAGLTAKQRTQAIKQNQQARNLLLLD